MKHRRNVFRAFFLVVAAAAAIFLARPPGEAFGQMERSGVVGIQNDTERQLFWSLLCTCGCPRETLGTCTCGFAHQRRSELRAELADGKTIEAIKAEYVTRFGTGALAVPPNTGSQRAVWIVPLLAILFGAGIVGFVLRRWVARPEAKSAKEQPKEPEPRAADETKYDDKLDEELKALDRE